MAAGQLTREESADYCRVSVSTFDRRIRPRLTAVLVGRRVFFWIWELDECLGKDGRSDSEPKAESSTFVVSFPAKSQNERLAREIGARLLEKHLAYTRPSSRSMSGAGGVEASSSRQTRRLYRGCSGNG